MGELFDKFLVKGYYGLLDFRDVKWYSKVATPWTFKYNKNVRRSSYVKETLHERFQVRSRKRVYEREYLPSY